MPRETSISRRPLCSVSCKTSLASYTVIRNQQKVHDLTQMNEGMNKKLEELNQKCEKAEMDYAILKSVDLNAHEEL